MEAQAVEALGEADPGGFERTTVRILPDGRMSAKEAAKYLDRAPATLASWRSYKVGPEYTSLNGRIYYFKPVLDRYIQDNRGLGLKHLSQKAAERRTRRRAREQAT